MSAQNLGTFWGQSPGGLSWAVGSWGRAGSWDEKRAEQGFLSSWHPLGQGTGSRLPGRGRAGYSNGLGAGDRAGVPFCFLSSLYFLFSFCCLSAVPSRSQSLSAPHLAVTASGLLSKPTTFVFGEHVAFLLSSLQTSHLFPPALPSAFLPPTLGQIGQDQRFILS